MEEESRTGIKRLIVYLFMAALIGGLIAYLITGGAS